MAIYFLLVETRGSKILDDRARRLTSETGIPHIADTDGSSKPQVSTFELVKTTASRPIVFLCTEPVVAAMATWAALLSVLSITHSLVLVLKKSNPDGVWSSCCSRRYLLCMPSMASRLAKLAAFL